MGRSCGKNWRCKIGGEEDRQCDGEIALISGKSGRRMENNSKREKELETGDRNRSDRKEGR